MTALVAVSPHLDDVVLSAAATVLRWPGPRLVVTVFTGDAMPPLSNVASAFHAECGLGDDAMRRRRAEDEAACQVLACEHVHLGLPEALYRRNDADGLAVTEERQLFEHDVVTEEARMIDRVATALARVLAGQQATALLAPIGHGHHRDHVIVRLAAERVGVRPFGYYDDQPYGWWGRRPGPRPPVSYRHRVQSLDAATWRRKRRALACNASQMLMLWGPRWRDSLAARPGEASLAQAEGLWVRS